MKKHVAAGTAFYTDALLSYDGLANEDAHKVIDHAESLRQWPSSYEWTREFLVTIETRDAEPTSALSRFICSATLMNNRSDTTTAKMQTANKLNDSDRFQLALSQIAGKAAHLRRGNWQDRGSTVLSQSSEAREAEDCPIHHKTFPTMRHPLEDKSMDSYSRLSGAVVVIVTVVVSSSRSRSFEM